MSEMIRCFRLDDPFTPVNMNRDEFYAKQIADNKEIGKPTMGVVVVHAFFVNTQGQFLIQYRSKYKNHNPNM